MVDMVRRLIVCVSCLSGLLAGTVALAQDPVLAPDTMPVADTIPRELPSPRAAFVRAMLVPGLGHFYVGEYRRGAVYFTLQSTSWFMLAKTLRRLGEVKDRDGLLTGLAEDSLAAAMAADSALAEELQDLEAYENALLTFPGLRDTRLLVRARKQQRQDWITYTLFFTFAAAVDAYVTTHLKDFPADVTARPAGDGGMSFSVHIPVGGTR
jgi:hypothetical protein